MAHDVTWCRGIEIHVQHDSVGSYGRIPKRRPGVEIDICVRYLTSYFVLRSEPRVFSLTNYFWVPIGRVPELP